MIQCMCWFDLMRYAPLPVEPIIHAEKWEELEPCETSVQVDEVDEAFGEENVGAQAYGRIQEPLGEP